MAGRTTAWAIETQALAIAALVAVVASGCLNHELVPCGSSLCPANQLCLSGDRCASPEAVEACAGVDENASCSTGGSPGRCELGVCVRTACGNGTIDPPHEVCDDGNLESGDGCRADCRKVEMCGDSEVDANERCDDGNANASDGCDQCSPNAWIARALIGGNQLLTTVNMPIYAMAGDRAGNLYFSEFNRVWRASSLGEISLVAGSGKQGSGGDGGIATNAELELVIDLAVDELGTVYVSTQSDKRIRRITPAGIIETFAGGGSVAPAPDGTPATSAAIAPSRLTVDGLGQLYFSDENLRVRTVDSQGLLRTVAGNGTGGSSGDGGPATLAQIGISDIAVDATGAIVIIDRNRIRRIGLDGVIDTVAGTAGFGGFAGDGGPAVAAQFYGPSSLAFDKTGAILVADAGNYRVRRFTVGGTISTIAGTGAPGPSGDGGPATAAALGTGDLVVNVQGLFVQFADTVRKIDAAGIISTHKPKGTAPTIVGAVATSQDMGLPYYVAADSAGNTYVTGSGHEVWRIDPAGIITRFAGTGERGFSGDGGPASAAQLDFPQGIATDTQGNVFIVDSFNHRVRRVDGNGVITTIAGTGVRAYTGDGGPATAGTINYPQGIAVDAAGDVYLADSYNAAIRKIVPGGNITTVAGGAFGNAGDEGPATSAELDLPQSVAVAADGTIYIADTDNNRVRSVTPDGIIHAFAGTGNYGPIVDDIQAATADLNYPRGVAVDPDGVVYITDTDNGRIRTVETDGVIRTLVGASAGFSGDGGPAAMSAVNEPWGIAIAPGGEILIAEYFAGRVRRVGLDGRILTIAGPIDPADVGPLPRARLSSPTGIVHAPDMTLYAGGVGGTIQAVKAGGTQLEVLGGRYPHDTATGNLARFRAETFGPVGGVAYDPARGRIFLTETATNRVYVVTMAGTDKTKWLIEPVANTAGTAGFSDGAASTAKLRAPTGLALESNGTLLYVADTGNHVVRAIDLTAGVAAATITTIAGRPQNRGYYGDGVSATAALLYAPEAMVRCANGDLFVADTGNHRVRRIGSGVISTVLGDGVAASTGDGTPAVDYPVDAPRGLACDAAGNVFSTSRNTVRMLPANGAGVVDGTGPVLTIYGGPLVDRFPQSITRCLTGIASIDATHLQLVDECSGLAIELALQPRP